MKRPSLFIVALLAMGSIAPCSAAAESAPAGLPYARSARAALRHATEFFTRHVAAPHGGYLYRYSSDLKWREGEGAADRQTAWLEPPGTGYVGEAYLYLYEQTGDPLYLNAAQRTARCLIRGQLQSGGWDNGIYFQASRRKNYFYRVDHPTGASPDASKNHARLRNVTTLDDNKTQSAVRFLILLDGALDFKDARLHETVTYALDALLGAQYPNGAWPQRFNAPMPRDTPAPKASYPESWSRVYEGIDYQSYYTFNDDTIADTLNLMLLAHAVYGDERYLNAALKCGRFMLDAQMPDPQPGWAQQYDHGMRPAWARKFEPASVSGGESRGVLRSLLRLYEVTLDPGWLE
ncbi:MAG: pectate lyase, partial [Planctomycetota bacterium]